MTSDDEKILVEVDDVSCEAVFHDCPFGERLVCPYDSERKKFSGYLRMDGNQICNGFFPTGSTMLFDEEYGLFSAYVKSQLGSRRMRLARHHGSAGVEFRVVVTRKKRIPA